MSQSNKSELPWQPLRGDCPLRGDNTSPSLGAEDLREQLANDGEIGPIELVAIPVEMVTRLRGILLDIDPNNFRKDKGAGVRKNPKKFFQRVIQPMLLRDSVLERAEVRISGNGIHVIIRFTEPVEFTTDGERRRWSGIVRAVQRLLPTDPNAPGINAMTRPIGSVNSKASKPVESLVLGNPVTADEVFNLFDEFRAKPFATVANILFGGSRITPCPLCEKQGSSMGVSDHRGHCYTRGCGKISIDRLYDCYLAPVNLLEAK